jgi:uncharacterized protein involved in tellurium resistance
MSAIIDERERSMMALQQERRALSLSAELKAAGNEDGEQEEEEIVTEKEDDRDAKSESSGTYLSLLMRRLALIPFHLRFARSCTPTTTA